MSILIDSLMDNIFLLISNAKDLSIFSGTICEETRPPAGDPWSILHLPASKLCRMVLLVYWNTGEGT